MACNSCAKSFSLLRKEKGCPGCGFSYCSKCLEHKVFLPKINAEAKVCSKCKRALNNANQTKTPVQPPDAYYKRLGVLDDKQATTASNIDSKDPKDQQILERLKKLKEDREKLPPPTVTDDEIKSRLQNIKGALPTASDAEIQARLAKLRGVPVETLTSKAVLIAPDTRTEQEQADDLLKQYLEATTIDTKYKDEFDGIISDMELRVQKLKGNDPSSSKIQSTSKSVEIESEDEEETVRKIVEKIKSESIIEDEIGPSTNDELPFCEICNEDARMRCLGCKYLFCKRCFNEHKDDDDDDCNRYEPYHAPATQH